MTCDHYHYQPITVINWLSSALSSIHHHIHQVQWRISMIIVQPQVLLRTIFIVNTISLPKMRINPIFFGIFILNFEKLRQIVYKQLLWTLNFMRIAYNVLLTSRVFRSSKKVLLCSIVEIHLFVYVFSSVFYCYFIGILSVIHWYFILNFGKR